MNLDFVKLCGKHSAIYEAYYKQVDSKGVGTIEAMTAARFLKKSGLSDVVLSRVWDLSDPNGKGYLDRSGFFVALKLVSLAQAGHVYNMNNIYMETEKPPKIGDLPKIVPPRVPPAPVGGMGDSTSHQDWSISVIDRLKYEQLFESLKPVGGLLAGNKVKGVLLDSQLSMKILGKIWDLADQDKDGNLDQYEFVVAMHLVYQTLEKRPVPDVLPPELQRSKVSGYGASNSTSAATTSGLNDAAGGFVANFPKNITPHAGPPIVPPPISRIPPIGGPATVSSAAIPSDPLIPIGAPPSVAGNVDWVVTASDLRRFEVMFRESDNDKDGLVSGLEVKNIFLKSGVSQKILAHIWALCDTNQSGKLTLEQFALAMWLVERKQNNIDPPQVLTANMVPPSMRGIVMGVDLQPQEQKLTYTNPELEMIAKEIEELAKERRGLETEIAQKEADIRIKSGEVRSLQSELDTLTATLKQLENQRGEALKRLDDLKAQVIKIREQCQKQEDTINEQEGELNMKRNELQKLKDEENALQKEYDDNNHELEKLTKHLQNTQLQISSIRSLITEFLETERQMTDALLLCKAAIDSGSVELVSEYQLKIEPDFIDARKILDKEVKDEIKNDPFNDSDRDDGKSFNNGSKTIATTNGFGHDPFVDQNTLDKSGTTTKNHFDDDSFNLNDGFDTSFGTAFSNMKANETTSSMFGNHSSTTGQSGLDPFARNTVTATSISPMTTADNATKDSFGSDPFAVLHAPTGQGQVLSANALSAEGGGGTKTGPPPRPESPSPALPPKKSKMPPPRPAPPKPAQPNFRPTSGTSADSFDTGENTGGSGGFADFEDFDNKAKAFSGNNHSITMATPRVGAAPIDFKDDPFKNYRYEDPFNIKDPFEDEEETPADPEQIFKNDISSTFDERNTQQTIANATGFNDASDQFLVQQFNAFDINFANKIPASAIETTTVAVGSNLSAITSTTTATATGIQHFRSRMNSSNRATPTLLPTTAEDPFEEEAELADLNVAFPNTSSMSSTGANTIRPHSSNSFLSKRNQQKLTFNQTMKVNNCNSNNTEMADFAMDLFSTNNVLRETSLSRASLPIHSNNRSNSPFESTVIVDAFGIPIESKDKSLASGVTPSFKQQSKIGCSNGETNEIILAKKENSSALSLATTASENNFEDDFLATAFTNQNNNNITNNNDNIGNNNDEKVATDFQESCEDDRNNNRNVAKNGVNLVMPLTSIKNNLENAGTRDLPEKPKLTNISAYDIKCEKNSNINGKFADDFSKAETFESDLELAIKRSILDQ